MKKVCLIATLLLLSVAALAQGTRPARPGASSQGEKEREEHAAPFAPKSSIVLNVNGLGCQTTEGSNMFAALAWSWGASNPATIGTGTGGAGAGKVNLSDLAVQKKFDQCSPALFGAVAMGKHFNAVTLTQEDSTGNVVLTLTMNEVFVTSWQAGGSVNEPLPTESVTFAFAKIKIEDTASGSKFCWDVAQNKGC